MSDQFYSYLSEKIIQFFNYNPLSPGAKYNIQFEKKEQVENLYEALKKNNLYKGFEYRDKGQVKYNTYLLNFPTVKLIISATIDDVQPDFLTRLRNMVGVEEGYKDKAILFIHDTTLDRIMGGTESFSKEGMPFNINSIQKDIKRKLDEAEFSDVDKEIIGLDLERKRKDFFSDSTSIFEYKDLLATVNGTCIEKDQYKNFGLFYDRKLKEFAGKKLKDRLKDNAANFTRVDEIHNYGNPEVQLEKYYDDKGVEKLKGEDWKDADFRDIEKSIQNKITTKPLEYLSCSESWDREEGASKAKARIRNIIVFNEEAKEDIGLEFSFDDTLYKDSLSTDGDIEVLTSGKKIKATIHNCSRNANFYKIAYKKDVKFEFRIVVVDFSEKYFNSIKTKYSVVIKGKNRYISINTNDSSIVFNEFASNPKVHELTNNYDTVEINSDDKLTLNISEAFEYENDSDLVKFKIRISDCIVPFGIKETSEKVVRIDGLKVWKLKRKNKSNFNLIGDNKLQHGTKEYFTIDEFRRNLELERQMIEAEGLCFLEFDTGLEAVDLELNSCIEESYRDILRYFKASNNLPSLTYLNEDLKMLYSKFIKVYLNEINNISEGSILTKEQKSLFKIGTIKRELDDRELMLTPLHPLNIAYQLHVSNELSGDEMEDDIIKKLSSTYLLPYIAVEEKKLYIPMEQFNSLEWKYYVDEKLPRYKSSRNFVSKLVNEKIEEFIGHFRYLFNLGSKAPIKINLINTGDSKEILQGIFKYYTKQLKSKNAEILPIDLYIYSNKNITNAFEEVAFNDNIEDLKENYGLDLNAENISEEDVLDLYREKVHFFSKKAEKGIEYAHLTFIEMNDDVKTILSNMNEIPSGIILNGMISGVPSVFQGDEYRTGFGTKYSNDKTNLMILAIRLNALNTAIDGSPFHANQCQAISISNNNKLALEDVYNSSHWVTFIDPKVDLNFFKNDPGAKDLLIIHYSDQYTTAGGYDAITVTRKSKPYQKVIEEYLTKKGVENAKEDSPSIINMFNAINGDWLLSLLSSKSHRPKEKISILAAIKLALAKFKKDNMIWVPISLEEILRVSGGAGLKQSEGFLSAKRLGLEGGVTSDDILLIGIEMVDGEVYVHYYPIEVKIGENNNATIEKGIEQAKHTKGIFNELVLPKEGHKITSTQKVYRNFLMQLAITSAEKLNLYEVCKEENWNNVIDSDLRRKLLNEEYIVSNYIEESLGVAAVVSFKKENSFELVDVRKEDNVMVIEMSEDDAFNFISKTVGEIRALVGQVEIKTQVPLDAESHKEGNINIQEENKSTTDINSTNLVDDIKTSATTINDKNINEVKGNGIVGSAELDNNLNKKSINSGNDGEIHKIGVERIVNSTASYENNINRSMKILFGVNQKSNKEIYWCPNDTNRLMHTNTGIIGTMGTGKTQFTKSMVTQIYREAKYNVDEKKVGILIFDYKGDYNKSKQDFIEATDAKVYKLFKLPFNPFYISISEDPLPMLPLHIASTFAETIIKAFGLGKKQEALLGDLIIEAYKRRGILVEDSETWNKPAPTLQDVYDIYEAREDIKKDDSLYAAFRKLIMYKIFEEDPLKTTALFDLIDGVTVLDLSSYDIGTQNLVVAITLDLFYSQMQAHGHSKINGNLRQLNKIILVDEADNFLSKNFESLKKILKEGREFGVGTILSTQLLSHFSTSENEYANYILTWVVHNVSDLSNKDVKYIFNTQSKSEEDSIYSKIKSLNKHYSLVKMVDSDRALFMKDMAFGELI